MRSFTVHNILVGFVAGEKDFVLIVGDDLWIESKCGAADTTHSTAFLFAYTLGNSKGIRQYHIGPFTCAADKELMLFNVQNGSTVYTHRTGSQSITNVDEYLRALTPDATAGYGSIYYANANGVSYSQHNNRYYVIAVTPLSGGGGGGM